MTESKLQKDPVTVQTTEAIETVWTLETRRVNNKKLALQVLKNLIQNQKKSRTALSAKDCRVGVKRKGQRKQNKWPGEVEIYKKV